MAILLFTAAWLAGMWLERRRSAALLLILALPACALGDEWEDEDRKVFEADLERFPGNHVAAEQWERSKQYLGRLRELRRFNPSPKLDRWIVQVDWMRGYWELLDDAHYGVNLGFRRHALERLRVLVGDAAFYSGWSPGLLPPPDWEID